MQKQSDHILETKRLQLRHISDSDLMDFYNIIGRVEVGRNLPKGEAYTLEETKDWIEGILEHWEKYNFGVWGISLKDNEGLIGYLGLRNFPEMQDIEVLYSLNPDYWGYGYATEAGRAVVKYGFEKLKLQKIIGLILMNNQASMRVLEKIGLHFVNDTSCFGFDCKYFEIINKN